MLLTKKSLLTILGIGTVGLASAQTDYPDTTMQEKGLLPDQKLQPVEIRALRAGSNAPFAVTEISKLDIDKGNLGQDLPYLLQYTPSTVVTSDAGAGVGYTGIRVRGTDGTRINVTMNGIPVNDAESQGAFFVDFPDIASSTGSIQLQRGVGTSTNGAGAFGATMSISNLLQYEEAGAELINSVGSFNTFRHTLRAGTGLMKNGFQFDVRASKVSSDGYIDRSSSDLKSMQIIAGWKASEKTSFRLMLMTGVEKTQQAWNGVPEDSLLTNRTYNELGMKADGTYYDDQTDNYQQDYYQFFADHQFSKYLSGHIGLFLTRGKGYYQEYRLGQSYSTYGLPDYITPSNDTISSTDMVRQLWLDNYYYGTVFSLIYAKKNTELTFGGGWNRYDGEHYGFVKWAEHNIPNDYRWYLLDAQKNDINVYAKVNHTINSKLILFGDLQYRNVMYDINGFRDNPTITPSVRYNFINPKAGVTYLIKNTAAEKEKVYASIAVANKEPNRNDFEASPNNLPKPEQLYDLEAGYSWNKQNVSLGLNYYYMYYNNQLVLTGQINDVGAYTRTNVSSSYRTGVELQAAYIPAYWVKLHGNVTFSQNKIENFTEYIDNYDDPNYEQIVIDHGTTDIAFSPNLIAAGGATFSPFRYMTRGQVFEIDLLGKYVGRQYLDNTHSSDGISISGKDNGRSINPYALCDIRIRYSIKLKPFKELAFNLNLNNIFDAKYVSNGYTFSYQAGGQLSTFNYYYPQAGFNWLTGVTMRF